MIQLDIDGNLDFLLVHMFYSGMAEGLNPCWDTYNMIERAHLKESVTSSSSQLFLPVNSNIIDREAGCL